MIGHAREVADHRHALLFLYDQVTMTPLPGTEYHYVAGMNDAGDRLVRVVNTPMVFWHDGSSREVTGVVVASGINSQGVVSGYGYFGNEPHAVTWQDGAVKDLGTLGGHISFAYGLNDNGVVVGDSDVNVAKPGHVRSHAFLWADGQMQDLGTFGGPNSSAFAVNNLGHAVGQAQDENNVYQTFFYDGVKKHRLPPLDTATTFPNDINNLDEIVGRSSAGAFITTGGHSYLLMDLLKGDPEWDTLESITSINDAGDLVGTGLFKGGHRRAFIAKRIKP